MHETLCVDSKLNNGAKVLQKADSSACSLPLALCGATGCWERNAFFLEFAVISCDIRQPALVFPATDTLYGSEKDAVRVMAFSCMHVDSIMSPLLFLLVVVAGVFTGILGALFGIGGGIFLIPVLVIGFGLPMHEAIAASIVTIIATSSTAAAVYVDKGISNIRLGMSLEVMTTLGAVAGGITANILPGDVLRKFFAVFLLLMTVLMTYRRYRGGEGRIRVDASASIHGRYFDAAERRIVEYSVRRLPLSMLTSLIAGNVSGLLGVGGGIVKVPVMNAFCGVPMKAATATSNFMIGVTAAASAFIYLAHGQVNPLFTAAAVIGVLGGSWVGTRIGIKIKGGTLVILFVLLMLFASIRMFF